MVGRELTSIRSPRVKAARRLAKRAFRHRDRRFLAEGPQAVREALELPDVLVELFTTTEAEARHADLIARAESAGVPVLRVSGEIMAELAQTVTPQGLLAVCAFIDIALGKALAPVPPLVTVLARVRDPGNAGTVLRTADAVSPAPGLALGFFAVAAIYAVLTVLTVYVLRRLAHSHDVAAPQELEAVP